MNSQGKEKGKEKKKKGESIVVISSRPPCTNPKYIYTVTCLYDIPPYCKGKMTKKAYREAKKEYDSHGGTRCFGWFSSLKKAKTAVENNCFDIHEYSYMYAVIEKSEDGFRIGIPKEWWYKWEGSHEEGHYSPIEKPEELKMVIHWGIG